MFQAIYIMFSWFLFGETIVYILNMWITIAAISMQLKIAAINRLKALASAILKAYKNQLEIMKYNWIVWKAMLFSKKARKGSLNLSVAFSLIGILIGAVVAFVVVSALFPTVDQAASDLQTSANNSNNTLVKKLAPVIPYIIGVGLFLIIMFPISWVITKLQS